MKLARNNKDLEQKSYQEEKSNFEIQQKRQEHFLRIFLTVVLIGTVLFFQLVELTIIVVLYLKSDNFPTAIISSIAATTSLFKVYVTRRILNYYFPKK